MKPCPTCAAANAPANNFCEQCGATLGQAAPAHDATVRWQGLGGTGKEQRRVIPLQVLFASKQKLLIGRTPDCDIYLPHPTISRRHAELEQHNGVLTLRDLESVNGVLVNGAPIREPARLHEHDRAAIGPFLLHSQGANLLLLDSSQSLRLEARRLEKVVLDATRQPRTLLDNINLIVEPGEFISLLGPSGSGKSTLMDCLNGRRPATGGQVLANGEDFYVHFDSFRQSLGYVPQRDIVHTQLSVQRALYYTARLRLPRDTDRAELNSRIEEVLDLMELRPHRSTMVGNLSGGQIKRVSLGAELLARPCLLYIDEATSGLDAGTEARMMRLFRRLANEGKSVVCITHNVDNVDLCNLILILMRGKIVYYGPPAEALSYFGVPRLSAIYDELSRKEPADWEAHYRASAQHEEYVARRQQASTRLDAWEAGAEEARPSRKLSISLPPALSRLLPTTIIHQPLWHQFVIVTARACELLWRDGQTLRMLALQAPLVAIFILFGFLGKNYDEKMLTARTLQPSERAYAQWWADELRKHVGPTVAAEEAAGKSNWALRSYHLLQELPRAEGPTIPTGWIVNPRQTYTLLFLIVLIVLWLGCNNASKEIVKEEAIYGRERAVNLAIPPYLASKFLVMTLITAVQALLLMLCVYGAMEAAHALLGWDVPWPGYVLSYPAQLGVLVLLAATGVALGLLLSACVSSTDRATALLPYVLIPQIILGGGILLVRDGPLYWLAIVLSPAYWAFRAVRCGETELPLGMAYDDSLWWPTLALLLQTCVLLGATAWLLRRKDVRRG